MMIQPTLKHLRRTNPKLIPKTSSNQDKYIMNMNK
jgi:hypothetical protein